MSGPSSSRPTDDVGTHAPTFDAIEVLTRSGEARDAFCAAVGTDDDVDSLLVSDLLRANSRVGHTLDTRRAVVDLCALVRAIDAAEAGRIDLEELRRGLELHSARTEGFAGFHDARILLRTLAEVLGSGRATAAQDRPVRSQLGLLHRELRGWLLEQATGDSSGDVAAAEAPIEVAGGDPRDAHRVTSGDARVRADELVVGLLHGARHHPVTGLLGAAWVRGWAAVPVAGDLLGDDPDELARLAEAVGQLGAGTVVQVARARSARWRIHGTSVVVGDRRRPAWELPATAAGLALAARERRGSTILTTWTEDFAYVEGDGHHLVLGPDAFVEQVVAMPRLEAIAAFRDHVEALAVDGEEAPPQLVEVATGCGRLRRRSR